MDELSTPRGCTDCGFGFGVTGDTAAYMLAVVARECGALEPWQADALLGGHAAGLLDRAEYERDMLARVDAEYGTRAVACVWWVRRAWKRDAG